MKAFIFTFGCKVNQYESQLLRERLARDGYSWADTIYDADAVFINSCTVTSEADRQCRQLIRKVANRNPGAKILISGCYAARASGELKKLSPRVEIAGAASINLTASAPASITAFDGHSRAFVKIQDGCNSFCSYCIVPFVRREMWSKPTAIAVEEIRTLVANGYPEIVLSGVRLGRYDGGLVPLLKKIIALQGRFRIRLSSLEALDVTDGLLDCMADYREKICAHLHIPMQSGSDAVLRRMNRPYLSDGFLRIAENIARRLPDAGITTDIIVGFPGETGDDFEQTHKLAASGIFSRLHVFSFSPRPGTAAEKFPGRIDAGIIKERAGLLRALDAGLQDIFWKRFIEKKLAVVREGTKNTLLSDNYIRLHSLDDINTISDSLFNVKLVSHNGKPAATCIS
ncbi:MAG: hypothetical protein A2219_06785 [Elusimicrobia bacterium RIFOXYA2_FULL_50_26]|nr:MAG: hypothetical protein A2219_06785 [Elusimicrobia bacterium RIFOXYA2_FULL_50_26]OGS24860.1 MAG: hypothetical protein A2314_03680 [Elusimicrobia bacterium RIFOXYB2_FULL_50_12]